MALPEQIRKQTEAVQDLYKTLDKGEETDGTTPTEAPATVAEVTQAPASADVNTGEIAAPSPANEQKAGGDNVPEETITQKYKTLQGMYNAEVPRMHQQNRELSQRVQQMEQLLASLSSAKANAPVTSEPAQKLVSEQDVADYGESIDVMRRVSREELGVVSQRLAHIERAIQQMQANVVPQMQAVAQRQQVSAEQQFWSDLSTAVPNFRQVNDNPDFQSWLLSHDPMTGITRQTFLDDAQKALDANRVANFFRAWLESAGQASVARSTGSATSANTELERQVTPGRSRSTGTPASTGQGKVYSPADIEKFFNDVRAGKFKGREADRSRIERDIFAAQRENRIQVNA